MRLFIFKSDASPNLRAFDADLAGMALPSQFRPWPRSAQSRPIRTLRTICHGP